MRGRSLSATGMLALAFAGAAAAQEYSFRIYGAAEGLQNIVVLSLAQDRAGYIWAGTEGGLYRYDGTRFRLMGPATGLPCSSETHGLFVASDGALWVNICAEIFRFDGRRFQAIPGLNALRRGAQVMADGANGSILITAPAGIYQASPGGDGSFRLHSYPLPAALAGERMYGIFRQGARLWFGCDQQLCLEEGGRVSVFGREQGLPADMWDGIQASPDGTVWVRSPKNIYRRAPGKTIFSQENPDIASSGFWGALIVGRDGSVMVPTDKGLAIRTAAGWNLVNRQRGLNKDVTAAVLEDREGSVWMGLAGGGVARWLNPREWEYWKVAEGLPSDLIWSIRRARKGAIWVGTGLGLARLDGSCVTRNWTRKDGLGGDNVRWLAESSDGAIWAATKPGGLARIDPATGKVRRVERSDGLPCDPEDVYVDRHDRLWVPTACGLFRNDRPSVSNRFVRLDTPESLSLRALKILEDAQGTFWVANHDGLWSLREGQWRLHRRAEGLLTDSPYVMALAADGSIWLRHRYDAGVDRMEVSGDRIARVTAIVPGDPKSVEVTAFHGFDAFGNFWRGGANGVAVLRGGTWTTFTTEDGLVWNDCDGEAFWADADGGVWLGTSGGLSHYQSGDRGPRAPLVADPTITSLKLIEPTRLLRVEFSTLNYQAEQLAHFAYRLDDEPWTDSGERSISIAGLGPGRHRLEIRSRVRDGPFSPRIAAADFQVKPTWSETWWARMLALAFGMAVISQFVRWRLRASARRQAELEAGTEQLRRLSASVQAARETEAARIARQIHDELGGTLTSFRWEVEALEKLILQAGDAGQIKVMRDKLIAMVGLTDTTINVVRRISSELRPSILDDLGLIEAVEWQTQQFQARTGIQCRCDCAVQSIPLAGLQCTAVFRIVQEALTNILRHAQATRACVALEEEEGVFILTVTDNGRGITQSETLSRNSLGLLGMQERAHLIGGQLDIVGLPGKGTTLRVRVPLLGVAR